MSRIYWLSGGMLLLAWLLPLHVPPWVSWHNEVLAAGAVLVPCALSLFLLRKPAGIDAIRLPVVAIPAGVLAAVALLQVTMGDIAYWGSFWVIAFYAATTVIASAAGYAAGGTPMAVGESALTTLAKVMLAAALAQLFVVFAQTLALWEGSDWVARTVYRTRGAGNVAQPNQAALLFLMGMASANHLYRRGLVRAQLALAAVAVMCVGLSVTESRSGVIGFCGLAAWWAYKGAGMPRWPAAVLAAGFVAALWALFVAWPPFIAAVWLLDGPVGVNLTASGRIEIWRQLLDAALLRPWLGWGVMQVAQAQSAVADAYPSVMIATFSHNVLLDVVLWAGFPTACALLVMAGVWAVRRLPMIRSEDAWYCTALALPLAMQSMTEFPYAYIYFLVPVSFALGALDASLGIRPRFHVGLRWAQASVAVLLAGYVWAAIEYTQIEEDFVVARFESMRVGRPPEAYERPKVTLLTQLGALLEGTRIQPAPSMRSEDIETLEKVAGLYPWAPAKFRYLSALALNGRMDEARRQMKIIRVMHGAGAQAAAQQRLDEMSETYPVLKELAAP